MPQVQIVGQYLRQGLCMGRWRNYGLPYLLLCLLV